MRTRGLVIAVAALLAILATAAVFMYVRSIKNEKGAGSNTVSVIVAKDDIPVGAKLDDVVQSGGVRARDFPRDGVVRGAVTDVGQLRGRITNAPILAGEQISTARLEGSSTQPQGGALGIPEGQEAVTFSLDTASAGGGVVQRGDHVTIYASFEASRNSQASNGDLVVTVVPDVQVLKVVQGVVSASSTESRVLLTLALRPSDASRVIFAQQKGVVWLALLPPNQRGENLPPTGLNELISGRTQG
jgi:Flp pilus assembly protein CpaB